jgi:hypothetical protein
LGAGGEPVALVHRVEPEAGMAVVSLSRPPGSSGATGSGVLVGLVFRARATGRSPLSIAQVEARNSARETVTLAIEAGEIVVQ